MEEDRQAYLIRLCILDCREVSARALKLLQDFRGFREEVRSIEVQRRNYMFLCVNFCLDCFIG